jgi:hypothetical protein
MPSNDDLYREMVDRDEADDARYRQSLAGKEASKVKPVVDYEKAQRRFEREIAPVFGRRAKARNNPIYRAFLKATGQWKGMDEGDVKLVDPSKGLVLEGPSVDEMQQRIAANPEAFKELAKRAPSVTPVSAERRSGVEPRLANEPRED